MATADTITTAKMLERVRALLAKADGTNFPAEADLFRAKADELMTAYAISQWQVETAQDGTNARPKPERRMINFDWWYDSEFSDDLWSMFNSVARHCRCVVANRGHSYKDMPVIGLASDLDYFDMLFTHLMLQMAKQLEPKPDLSKSIDENAYILRRAGLQRQRITELMYDAKLPDGSPAFPELQRDDYDTYADLNYPTRVARRLVAPEKLVQGALRRRADKYADDNGFDKTTNVHPKVWQRSFADGFVNEVSWRMTKMRQEQESRGEGDSGPSVAVAIRDIRQQAMDLYNELYPPPVPPKCKEEGCERDAYYGGYCEEHCKLHGIRIPKGRMITREVRYSSVAYNAGTEAGKKADLAGHPGKGVGGGRGALPR